MQPERRLGNAWVRGAKFRVAMCLGVIAAGVVYAQAPLQDPIAYLLEHEIDAGEDTLQAAWVERGRGPDARYVYGFRLAVPGAAQAEDIYFDAATGERLGAGALRMLGIFPKPAHVEAAVADAEIVVSDEAPAVNMPKAVLDAVSLPEILLPPIDKERLLAEDAARDAFERGTLRLGVAEDLPEPISAADIRATGRKATAGGKDIHGIALRAPGALGLRLHILVAPETGSQLRVYDPARPGTIYTPPRGDSAWWTPTLWSDAAIIECAPGADFTIDRALQAYRQPQPSEAKAAGACEVDVSCRAHWESTATGVGGVGTIENDEFVFCTGSLLVDSDPDTEVPYFLTANHCVNGPSQASPLEIYWLYQTTRCNGEIPDIGDVPRTTGGANFLAGNGNYFGTDFTLLRLRKAPPSGLTWLGWETAAPALGADIVTIHHPDGDYKRISFGDITDRSARLRPASRFHEVRWSTGVTEPGSSGGPLFLNGTQRIIGQLYGGTSACSAAGEPDYYGRFDVSFLSIQQYLGVIDNPFDVNGDREINAADLQQVVNAALTRPNSAREDFDGNGRVQATDIQAVVLAVLSFSR